VNQPATTPLGGRLASYEHDGFRFEVTDVGPHEGRVVIMLHGFPEDRHQWEALWRPLAGAGHRVLAPDQRGYSPAASPRSRRAYRMQALTGDVLALADAAGAERFDLVGHDWGALVGWALAAASPGRVRSLCALSVPHPGAMRRAMARSSQALRSSYAAFFQLPWLPERLLSAGGGRLLEAALRRSGLDEDTARRFACRAARPGALTGALNWYRALPFDARAVPGPVCVPTLYVWGERDRYVTRAAAEGCRQWVHGPYRFEALAGRSHWLPTTAAEEVSALLAAHLASARP
jgi:pimeloyl-ACP methyl ester carboxylesterase